MNTTEQHVQERYKLKMAVIICSGIIALVNSIGFFWGTQGLSQFFTSIGILVGFAALSTWNSSL